MPRSITSDIGAKTLTIDDISDNFAVGTDALPNGDQGLKWGTTPDATSRAFCRTGVSPFLVVPGQAWSMNFWLRGGMGGGNCASIFGVQKQDTAATSISQADTVHWVVGASGNVGTFSIWRTGTTFQTWSIGNGTTSSSTWVMYTVVFDPTVGTYGTITTYINGTQQAKAALVSNPGLLASYELFFLTRGNYALSALYPASISGVGGAQNGAIAKLAFFDSVVSAADIAALYVAMNA